MADPIRPRYRYIIVWRQDELTATSDQAEAEAASELAVVIDTETQQRVEGPLRFPISFV